MMVMEDEEEG